ncbi:MAG: hypothetical protein ACRDSH_02995 [Pseudonocardiaceae bacterium]
MTETERRPREADRGDVDDQHRAGTVGTEGSTAALLTAPGLDGRLRRAWRAQKVADWTAGPPRYFTDPRPTCRRWPRRARVNDSPARRQVLTTVGQ